MKFVHQSSEDLTAKAPPGALNAILVGEAARGRNDLTGDQCCGVWKPTGEERKCFGSVVLVTDRQAAVIVFRAGGKKYPGID